MEIRSIYAGICEYSRRIDKRRGKASVMEPESIMVRIVHLFR